MCGAGAFKLPAKPLQALSCKQGSNPGQMTGKLRKIRLGESRPPQHFAVTFILEAELCDEFNIAALPPHAVTGHQLTF